MAIEPKNDSETVVTIVRPNRGFQENFEDVLVRVDTENWVRSKVWEPSFIKKGIRLIHRHYGKPGKMKTRSAIVKHGFDVYVNEVGESINEVAEQYDKAINGPSIFSDQISSGASGHQHLRDTVGSDPEYFYIESSLRGRIHDIADAMSLSYSDFIRHLEAICIADCDFINEPRKPAEEYTDFLFNYTKYARIPVISAINESMERWEKDQR